MVLVFLYQYSIGRHGTKILSRKSSLLFYLTLRSGHFNFLLRRITNSSPDFFCRLLTRVSLLGRAGILYSTVEDTDSRVFIDARKSFSGLMTTTPFAWSKSDEAPRGAVGSLFVAPPPSAELVDPKRAGSPREGQYWKVALYCLK